MPIRYLKKLAVLSGAVFFVVACADERKENYTIVFQEASPPIKDPRRQNPDTEPLKPKEPLEQNKPWVIEDLKGMVFNNPSTPQNPASPSPQGTKNNDLFKLYKNDDIKRTFADVAGLEEPKKALKTIVDYLQDPVAFGRLGAAPPTGVIFYGPPGTGKTEIARAFAGEVSKVRKVSFIVASGASFENKYVGVGADNVRKLFELARENKPAIIFIDEFDAVAGKRSEEKKNAQVVNQLLTELDGFSKEERSDIFVVAATNLLNSIDPAVIRPGRIDRKVKIGLPDKVARKAVLNHYMTTIEPVITGIKIDYFVKQTNGWSAAELKTLVNEARIHATTNNATFVSDNDFKTALSIVKSGRRNP